jgi:hypothetical protein
LTTRGHESHPYNKPIDTQKFIGGISAISDTLPSIKASSRIRQHFTTERARSRSKVFFKKDFECCEANKKFWTTTTTTLTIASSIDLFWLAWCDMSTTQKNKSWLTRTREPSGSVLTTIMVFFRK